jgi:hypothetical protein
MPLASAVLDEVAALCGDRNKTLYTSEKLLPLLIRANRDLSLAFQLAGVGSTEGIFVTTGTVDPGETAMPDLPSDLVLPIELWERPAASTSDEDWVPMTQMVWPQNEPLAPTLRFWQWEGDAILFLGSTESHKIKMRYSKNLGTITGTGSSIVTPNAEHFLAAKTASYAARFIGKNVALGAELNREAQEALDLLLNVRIKEDQNVVGRMLPYSMNARRR